MAIEIATKKEEITRNNKEDRNNDFGHDLTHQISEPQKPVRTINTILYTMIRKPPLSHIKMGKNNE